MHVFLYLYKGFFLRHFTSCCLEIKLMLKCSLLESQIQLCNQDRCLDILKIQKSGKFLFGTQQFA